MKDDDKDILEGIGAKLKKALLQKEAATTTEQKLKAGQAVEDAKNGQRQVILCWSVNISVCVYEYVYLRLLIHLPLLYLYLSIYVYISLHISLHISIGSTS